MEEESEMLLDIAVTPLRQVGPQVMYGRGPWVGLRFVSGRLPGFAAELWAVVGEDDSRIAPPQKHLVLQCLDEVF